MFRALSIAAATAAFVLAVLGSWVRINGAGLTCPDWPLCRGSLIPTLEGGVALEWGHRAVAFLLAILITAALVAGWGRRRELAFVRRVVVAIAVLFAVQVALGAATVALANSPSSVVFHWITGMLLLGGLVCLAVLAVAQPVRGMPRRPGPFAASLGVVALLAFATMGIGAYVSSSGAGLACSTLPDCDGTLFGVGSFQSAQMLHRAVAGLLLVAATVAMYWSVVAARARVRAAMLATFSLLVLQIMLGLANVALYLPTVLREAHAANAVAVFIAAMCALCFGVLDGARAAIPARSSRTPLETVRVRTQ